MSKKLFLSSSFEDVATLLPEFEKNLVGKKVTFIPTASIVEQVAFFVESGKKSLEELIVKPVRPRFSSPGPCYTSNDASDNSADGDSDRTASYTNRSTDGSARLRPSETDGSASSARGCFARNLLSLTQGRVV